MASWAVKGSVATMVSPGGASPAVVAAETAARVAGLVTVGGGVAAAPGAVGIIATVPEFVAVNSVGLMVR